MSVSLSDLSNLIDKEIRIHENDVEPRYLPNQQDLRNISDISIDVFAEHFEKLKKKGALFYLEKTQKAFEETFFTLRGDIKKRGYWSYWHYFAFSLITCFAYEELIKTKKHETVKLDDPANWNPPSLEVAVLAFNYVSTQLYPDAIYSLKAFSDRKNVSIIDLLELMEHKIKKMHGIKEL